MLPTLSDIKQIAERLGIAYVNNKGTFDLDVDEPLALHMTYNRNQGGINSAFIALAKYEETLNGMKKARDKR